MKKQSLFIAAAFLSSLAAVTPAIAQPIRAESATFPAGVSPDVLAVQVLLDRARHSPGVIDGRSGGNTARAIRAFQMSAGLPVDGRISADLLQRLRTNDPQPLLIRHRLTEEDVAGPFVEIPEGFTAQAELEKLAYSSAPEKLAERFHMAQSFLRALNPNTGFTAGEEIWVVSPGQDKLEAKVARIEVDKAASALRAYTAEGTLVATYPATIGSSDFPSPSGSMEVRAIAPVPAYYFNPEGREWGPNKNLTIAPGPNNPVGSTWIDLTHDGYGIHGTPDPRLIGKTASHGCVRLTNWDAEELATAVAKGTKVEFVS